MAIGSFSHPASDGLTQLLRSATAGAANAAVAPSASASLSAKLSFGPLSKLFGTWVGDQGWNLIAIPTGEKPKFQLIVRPYYETITFTPITSPVLNHGGPTTESIMGALYSLQINDKITNELLHIENGMWLLLSEGPTPPPELMDGQPTIARQATVPHGDSVLAVGTWSTDSGAPEIPDVSSLPQNDEGSQEGYTDPYIRPNFEFPQFPTETPFKLLSDVLASQTVVETTTFTVGTTPMGGIVNLPFIRQHVDATQFTAAYWVETVQGDDGTTFQQLQYAQNTILEFFEFDGPGKVRWPHMNLNTLVKL
ncbi:MAG TPA: heme-binding protein [Candidatus Elarobacter sp.]|jgi:hypothetical protein|nr:heme-binding protein [Candidatus Elarobacter sp.]